MKPKELLDRWLTGYLEILRPRLLIGHYRAAEKDPEQLEQLKEKVRTRLGADHRGPVTLSARANAIRGRVPD